MLGESRPQALPRIRRIFVEAVAALLAEATELVDHQGGDLVGGARHVFVAEVRFRLLRDLVHQFDGDFVGQRQRAHRHAGQAAGVVDQRRGDALLQQGHALGKIGAEDAAGVEAARVVDHDRRLADGAHEVHRARQRRRRGLLAEDDFHQRHLLGRREEVQADEVGGACARLGEPGDGQGGRVGGEDGVGGNRRLAF